MALLDDTANADAAWSVRLLRDAYAGDCLRVRRSSDNAEMDIGFDGNGNLDTTALLSFVGAGDGFVATWYDQTGNGRDHTESVAADQPQIVDTGSVVTQGVAERPAIFGDGAGDRLRAITTMPSTGDTAFSVFSVHNQITAENFTGMVSLQPGTIVSDRRFIAITREAGNTKAIRLVGGNTVYTEMVAVHHRWASIYSSGGGTILSWVDGSSLTVDSFNNSGLNIRSDSAFCLFMGDASGGVAGAYSDPGIAEGYVQEVLWYLSDQTANREAIDESQAEYFSVHALTANSIATGAPTVGSPALTQTHALTATSIATGDPTVGRPALTQNYQLTAISIATGAPTVGRTVLTVLSSTGPIAQARRLSLIARARAN